MAIATRPPQLKRPPRSAPSRLEDTQAFTVPWRTIAISIALVIAVMAAWSVTTNTYAVLGQQRLQDRWADTVARGEALESPVIGQAVARISIPALGIERVVVEGAGHEQLRTAPGHLPDSALPGTIGNSVIRGHRLLWSGPFRRIGELNFGSQILVELADGRVHTFLVSGIFHMLPDDPDIVSSESAGPMITLVTSDPPFRADRVLVVKAFLPLEEAP
jgi:sortase A